MNTNPNTEASSTGATTAHPTAVPHPPSRSWLPGLVAVGIYMVLLAVVFIANVVGRGVGPIYLVFSALFIAAGIGLLFLRRWAWALSLAAVAILGALFLRIYWSQHAPASLAQALVNLVIFLYLVRTEVRERLR